MINNTVSVFRSIFENELGLLRNSSCAACDAQIKHPLLPWIVGANYFSTAERILFVGKPHYGRPGTILPSGIIDPTTMVNSLASKRDSPYWSSTRAILEKIYDTYGTKRSVWDNVAFSNIVKCTNVDSEGENGPGDRTSRTMVDLCVGELGVIAKEIAVLEPRHVIFYTYVLLQKLNALQTLRKLPNQLDATSIDIAPETNELRCGNQSVPWWDWSLATRWCSNMRVLVTRHPQGAPKEFVPRLLDWIGQGRSGNDDRTIGPVRRASVTIRRQSTGVRGQQHAPDRTKIRLDGGDTTEWHTSGGQNACEQCCQIAKLIQAPAVSALASRFRTLKENDSRGKEFRGWLFRVEENQTKYAISVSVACDWETGSPRLSVYPHHHKHYKRGGTPWGEEGLSPTIRAALRRIHACLATMPTRDYILGDVRDDSVMIAFRMAMPDAERQRVLQVPSILAGFLRRCCEELADAIQRAHGQ